jgi:DNA ligase (NAD+)
MAFKWADEQAETTLREIEWSPSRTGLINPVAVFDPVELEGTTVSRASVHNISIVKALALGIGDRIMVYKANMIIPQIAENKTMSGKLEIPSVCPSCGGKTEIKSENGTETLYCTNPDCPAKNIKLFTHFVSRNAMNIDGLSEATLEKLIDKGFLHSLDDIYHLDRYQEEICSMEGFGQKSYDNMLHSIEASRNVNLASFLYGLGILNVGLANAKLICRHFNQSLPDILTASQEELCEIDGIGEVIAKSIYDYFRSEKNRLQLEKLCQELHFVVEETAGEQDLAGKVFVVTGSLEHFANRDELKKVIEDRGGKVTGSVTGKTDYLINNDILSNSSKNKKAKSLNVPIISEEDFLNL